MRNVTDKSCTENQNTHFVFSTMFPKILRFLRKTLKNFVERGRSQMTIRRMRIVGWMNKATNIHSEYIIRIAFPLQRWLHQRTSCNVISSLTVWFILMYMRLPTFIGQLILGLVGELTYCEKYQRWELGFEVLTVVLMTFYVFWNMTSDIPEDWNVSVSCSSNPVYVTQHPWHHTTYLN
jgi:hypothetical protein